MGALQRIAEANAGVTALATARTARAVERSAAPADRLTAELLATLVEQNQTIIELLQENLGYLARQKAHEVQQASKQ